MSYSPHVFTKNEFQCFTFFEKICGELLITFIETYQFATQRLLSGLASAVSWPAPKFKNKAVLGAWLVLNISKVGAQFASHPRLVNKQGNLLKGINNKTVRRYGLVRYHSLFACFLLSNIQKTKRLKIAIKS